MIPSPPVDPAPLPCPFCGRPATYRRAKWEGERSTVDCGPCQVVMGGIKRESLESVVRRWNVRVVQKAAG